MRFTFGDMMRKAVGGLVKSMEYNTYAASGTSVHNCHDCLQVVEDGYEFFAKRQLVTIFSAPNYCGEFDNAGAMMSVDETLMCSFQVRFTSLHLTTFLIPGGAWKAFCEVTCRSFRIMFSFWKNVFSAPLSLQRMGWKYFQDGICFGVLV